MVFRYAYAVSIMGIMIILKVEVIWIHGEIILDGTIAAILTSNLIAILLELEHIMKIQYHKINNSNK